MARNITVTFEDGTTHVYQNAPDDATPDAVSARAAKDFGKAVTALDGGRAAASAPTPTPAKAERSTAEKIAGDPLMRLAVGAAEPVQGAVQRMSEKGFGSVFPMLSFAAKMARPKLDESFADTKKMARGDDKSTDFMGIAGNVMSPASLAAGKIAIPASLLGKTALGAGAGAGGGLLAPAANADEARKNAGIGAAVGGALPPLIVGGAKLASASMDGLVRPMADLFAKQGPQNILNRYIRGDKVVGEHNLPKMIAAARNATEILPGGKPTVADAVAGMPEGSPLSALQGISATTAIANPRFGQRILDQTDAITNAEKSRSAMSAVNYGKAFDPSLHKLKPDAELASLVADPYFQSAVPTAAKVAQARGLNEADNLTEILHTVKMGLDKKLKPGFGEVGIDNAERGAILDLKKKLTAWLVKNNSDYKVGRDEHAAASKLIDDYTKRQELAAKPLQATNLGGGINIAEETRPHLPNLLSRPAMMLNWAMRKAGGGVEPRVDKALADMMLDPSKFADEMSKLPPKTRIDIEKWLRKSNALSAGVGQAQ